MTADALLRAVELLAKIAERLALVDARLGEIAEKILLAVAGVAAQLKRGGERAGKAERALADRLDALPTSEAIGEMIAGLKAREDERHAAQIAALARIEARLSAIESRPAPTTWADLFGRHPALLVGLAAVLAALAGWLGGKVPTIPAVEPTPPTAVLPGAGSRLMNDRRLAGADGEG